MFIERLWRSLKYEDVYLREYGSIKEITAGVGAWLERYNMWRPHESLENGTPELVYTKKLVLGAEKDTCQKTA